jgi:hypothetical protein
MLKLTTVFKKVKKKYMHMHNMSHFPEPSLVLLASIVLNLTIVMLTASTANFYSNTCRCLNYLQNVL